jgi:hypothetical protein
MRLEERLQNVINSLDAGGGQALLRLLIAGLLVLGLLVVYASAQFRGLRDPEAMELAQLGRGLAAGEGYRTACLRPIDAWCFARGGRELDWTRPIPEIRRAPAFPALLSAGFRLLRPPADATVGRRAYPAERRVILPVGMVLTLLTTLLVYGLATGLFGSAAGGVAAGTYALSNGVLAATISGRETPLAGLLITGVYGLALAAVRLRDRHARPALCLGAAALGGGLAGLAALTAYRLGFVVLAVLPLFAVGFVRWRRTTISVWLAAMLLVVTPWLIRNAVVSGRPLGSAPLAMLHAGAAPGDGALERTAQPQIARSEALRIVGENVGRNLQALVGGYLYETGSGLVVAFFLVVLLARLDADNANRLKWSVALGVALLALTSALASPDSDAFLPLYPMIAVLAAGMLFKLLDDMPFLARELRAVIVVLWVGLAALPAMLAISGRRAPPPYPPYSPVLAGYAAGLVPAGCILATDIPWATAWYGGQPSMLLPRATDELVAMRDAGVPIGAVYLTTQTGNRPYVQGLLQGPERSWLPLLNRMVPADFPWKHGIALPPGRRDQILLLENPQWEEK